MRWNEKENKCAVISYEQSKMNKEQRGTKTITKFSAQIP